MEAKIDRITQILSTEIVSEIGLLTGIGGQILLCSELYTQNKISQEWLQLLQEALEKKLLKEDFIFTHCSGLAGIGWLYEYLSQRKIIDYDTNSLLEDFDSYLELSLKNFMQQRNYDFLHGGVGVALYFTKRVTKKKELVETLIDFVKDLEKISTKQKNGTIKWLSVLNHDTFQKGYNISLSHGMSSIITLLSKLYKIGGVDKEKIELLLRDSVQYVLAQEINKDKYGSFFPGYALESTTTISKSRMGWCYGDLGIATSLYQAGTAMGEKSWIEKALEVLQYAALNRRDLEDNSVKDAGLCHGAAGVGHIFYRMWWNSKLPEFKEAADFWFAETLKMAYHKDGLAGFKTLEMPDGKPNWMNKYCLLTGIVGIGLALLTYHNKMEPAWDECLLLS